MDAHKADGVKYQHVLAYANLFNYCYANPYQLAQLMAIGDQLAVGASAALSSDHISAASRTIATGLYGSALNSADTQMVLQLLKHLIELQIVTNENPRRMLRTGSCAFARFYHSLHESLFSAKMFLTVALNDPILRVLIDDEVTLELDPSKAAMNLPAAERQKRFGSEQDAEYPLRVKQYVSETTSALHRFVAKFIRSLSNSWCLFPATLRWLVKTMCYQLRRAKFDERCIYEISMDMVLINFICPAIVSPEVYGITDCPISDNARANLITIGQILQQMALLKYQPGEPKYQELFDKFEPNEVSDLLSQLLELETPDRVSPTNTIERPTASHAGEVQRSSVLVSLGDLNLFVDTVRIIFSNDELNVSGECRRKLGDILATLPHKLENLLTAPAVSSSSNGGSSHEKKASSSIINLGKQTKQKLSKAQQVVSQEELEGPRFDPAVVLVIPVTLSQVVIEMLSEEEVMRVTNAAGATNTEDGEEADEDDNSEEQQLLNAGIENGGGGKGSSGAGGAEGDAGGVGGSITTVILSEQNVVELQRQHGQETENPEMIILKADRSKHFAMINDDEAVSEAHSNHSVASSLDSENDQNDNLSDMVSANVSGRGSPNISGRDTPSSQITEGNERPPVVVPAAKYMNKARSDIQSKFCKFEIKSVPAGDETVSIMSDTWSTDVLASDSETLDAGSDRDRQFSTPLIPANVILPGDNDFVATLPSRGGGGGGVVGAMTPGSGPRNTYDISETQSESAWSMDVLASDSEKLAEIDTDDNQSIAARSDITDASSAPEGPSYRDGNNNNQNNHSGHNIPDSPFLAARSNSSAAAADRRHSETNPESPSTSKRTESIFFNQRRSNVENDQSQAAVGEDSRFMAALRRSGTDMSRNSSFQSDGGGGQGASTAAAAASTTGNPFLTPRSDGAERNKKLYSARQQSSESNQSSTFDGDLKHDSFGSWKDGGSGVGGGRTGSSGVGHQKKSGKSSKGLSKESIIRTNSNLANPFALTPREAGDAEELPVEHRSTSMEQRNVSYDGRRNGMMQITSQSASLRQSSTSMRNYENHEIIMRHRESTGHGSATTTTTTSSKKSSSTSVIFRVGAEPEMGNLLDLRNEEVSTITAGGRQQEDVLVQKTRSISLMPSTSSSGGKAVSGDVMEPYRNGFNLPNGTVTQAGKFTGAIPKSISFDASADKRYDHDHHQKHQQHGHYKHQRSLDQTRGGGGHGRGVSQNSSFLNKIRQGLKSSGRKSNKQGNGGGVGNNNHNHSKGDQSQSWDGFNSNVARGHGGGGGGGATDVGNLIDIEDVEPAYQETSEEILAKYRRKVSTASSEANGSDSTSSRASSSFKSKNSTDSDFRLSTNGDMLRLSLPLVSSNDLFHFNNAKKKLRTVLSSADVHTTDFRYNLVSLSVSLSNLNSSSRTFVILFAGQQF